jgi:hypothetical protein
VVSEGRRPDTQAELANERTYLAWLRTGLALVAAGVAAERVLPAEGIIWARQLIGVTLILAAGCHSPRWRPSGDLLGGVGADEGYREPSRIVAGWPCRTGRR